MLTAKLEIIGGHGENMNEVKLKFRDGNRVAWIGKTIRTTGGGPNRPMLLGHAPHDHRIDASSGVVNTSESDTLALRGAVCEMQASQRQV